MIELAVVLVPAFALAYLLMRKRKPRSGWRIEYSHGFPAVPPPHNGGWKIDFPADPRATLHYVMLYGRRELRDSLTLRVRVEGGPFVAQEYPENPAKITLMLQRRGMKLAEPSHRFYSSAAIPLTPGEHTLTVPLTIEHWSDVFGGQDPGAFRAALEPEAIGVLFGSDGGRGHGVYAVQGGSLTLLELR